MADKSDWIVQTVLGGIGFFLMPLSAGLSDKTVESLSDFLSKNQKNRLHSFQNPEKLAEFIETRILINGVLRSLIEVNFDIRLGHAGKPYIYTSNETQACFFNISHTKNFTVLAVTNISDVGVDVESGKREISNPLKLAKRYLHPDEVNYITQKEDKIKERFLTVFTLKESLVKCTGTGIANQFKNFSVVPFLENKQMINTDWKMFYQRVMPEDLFLSCSIQCSKPTEFKVKRVGFEDVLALF